jgi:hypothetical protein
MRAAAATEIRPFAFVLIRRMSFAYPRVIPDLESGSRLLTSIAGFWCRSCNGTGPKDKWLPV